MELAKTNWGENLLKIRPKLQRLLYKGNIDLLLNDAPKLAVVGSRRMSDYGERVIESFMPSLVQNGVIIVSGFMYGVDQTAHKTCLENGGKTIAVLGWGIDWKVSSDDEKLYRKILDVDSLMISEYGGETRGSRWTFPQRNRIVAGIADAVLVVEAAKDSGSLITAKLATSFGKKLLAVPGQVTNKVAEGANELIKSKKAVMVDCVDDVLKELGMVTGQLKIGFNDIDLNNPILAALEDGEKSLDELALCLKMPLEELMQEILDLELTGFIESDLGKYSKKIKV